MNTALDVNRDTVFNNYVDGRWVSPVNGPLVERRNPSDLDDLIGLVPLTSRREVGEAIDAATRAFRQWRVTPAPVRGRLLSDVSRLLEARAIDVAGVITREQGKTLTEAHGEVALAINVLEYMAGEGRRLAGETLPSQHYGKFVYTIRQPLGVVGLITPWNFPLAVPLWKIASALICGNSIVWKPSKLTPLTSEAIAHLFDSAGLPAGVLNTINGAGGEAGAALVEHPGVRAISFTSSYDVGTRIYSKAAALFKKVQCQTGGNNAAVVLEDADLEWAAESIVAGAFKYAGQRCTATSRVIAVDRIADALLEMLVKRAEAIIVGPASDPGSDMGPVADEQQLTRLLNYIDSGSKESRLVSGGRRLTGQIHDNGFYISPTIFDLVAPSARIAQDELFGPIISIIRVPDWESALAVANSNRYGMAAAVFTNSGSRIFASAEALDCGIVQINAPTIGAEVHVPFGGIKDTGVGYREMGSSSLDFYSELKVVYVNQRPFPHRAE